MGSTEPTNPHFIRPCSQRISKNLIPLKPHFYVVKLGFTGVVVIFLILLKENIDFRYSLEPPRRGGSNECPQSMFSRNMKKVSEFLSENFPFLVVKFSIYWIGVFS